MTMPELFSLRWNDFYNNLVEGIHTFLQSEDMVDVTLSAEGELMRAHKLILSLSSPYFRELFKCHMQYSHPIVVIKDVQAADLKLILKFMYTGEVTIHRKDLSGFLQTAESLQIKGLTQGKHDDSTSDLTDEQGSTCEAPSTICSEEKKKSQEDNKTEVMNDSRPSPLGASMPTTDSRDSLKRPINCKTNELVKKIKREWRDSKSSSGSEHLEHGETTLPADFKNDNNDDECAENITLDYLEQRMNTEDFGPDENDRKKKVSNGSKPKVGGAECPFCNRIFANRYNLKVHVRDKHSSAEGSIKCNICEKEMRNRSCLRVHLYHHRKQAALENNDSDQSITATETMTP